LIKNHNRLDRARKIATPYLLIAPSVLMVFLVLAYPVASGFVMSFYDIDLAKAEAPFVGLSNYIYLFSDPSFINSFIRTLVFAFSCISLGLLLSMIFALGIYSSTRYRNLFKTIGLIPYLVSGVATAIIFRFIFQRQIGGVNLVLEALGFDQLPFLASTYLSVVVVILANSWFIVPFSTLVITAGMECIDRDIYDACKVDGASATTRLFRITLPLISPMIGISLVWLSLASFNMFDIVIPLTGGGPAYSTEFMAVYMYNRGFRQFRYSIGTSIMSIILFFNITLSLIYLKVMKTTD